MTYYLGDPCYIIPDEDWHDFCDAMHNGKTTNEEHLYSVMRWKGQNIAIWTNGGDGCWEFNGVGAINGAESFGVDAGVFCVIDLDRLGNTRGNPATAGMLFEKIPSLSVEDDIIYVNGVADNSVTDCPNFRCNRVLPHEAVYSCDNGVCEGCDYCYECDCEED